MNNLNSSNAAQAGGASSVVDGLAEFRQLAGMSGFAGGYGASASMGASAAAAPIGGYMAAPGIATGGSGMAMGMPTGAMGGRTAEEDQLLFSLVRVHLMSSMIFCPPFVSIFTDLSVLSIWSSFGKELACLGFRISTAIPPLPALEPTLFLTRLLCWETLVLVVQPTICLE